MSDEIRIASDGAVLEIGIERPAKKNALTGAMYDAMRGALDAASADADVGAVLIRGAGGAFTAGNDIGDFLAATQAAQRDGGDFPARRFIQTLARFEKPLVAAVDGVAVGIGTTLCFHCDLVYVAPGARFRMPFVDLGLVPEAGSSLLAVQRFGRARASELLMLAEGFDGARAVELGLANALVPAEALLDHARDRARALAAKPRQALLATRRLMRGDPEALYRQMDAELEAFGEALRSPEARNAFLAFMGRPKTP